MKKSVVLLALLAGLVLFALVYKKSRHERVNSARLQGAPMRELLLPDLAVKDIRKLRIREDKAVVNLEVQGDRWVVSERSNYPAAFDRINRVVEDLAQTKITAKNDVGQSVLPELRLLEPSDSAAPDSTGLYVELMNEKGEVLASFVAGVSTQTTGGANSGNWMGGVEQRYVRTPQDASTVWMTSNAFNEWSADPKQWLSKAFVAARDIKSIAVKGADEASSWTVERADAQAPFKPQGAAPDQELEASAASTLPNLLSGTVFNDVQSADKAAELFKDAVNATITTFDGFVYELKLALKKQAEDQEAGAAAYLSLKISANLPAERTVPADEKPEDKKANDEAFAASKKALESRLADEKKLEGWVFEIPQSSVETLLKKRSEIFVAKKDEPAAAPVPPTPGLPQIPMPAAPPQ